MQILEQNLTVINSTSNSERDELLDELLDRRRIARRALDFPFSRRASLILDWLDQTIPFRKLGGRIIFLRSELETWLSSLDGCTLDEAKTNQEARRG